MFRFAILLIALLLATPSFAARCGGDFNTFVAAMSAEAQAAGISANVVSSALGGVQQDMAVLSFDRRQRGTFNKSFEQYVSTRVGPGRINTGRAMLQRHAALQLIDRGALSPAQRGSMHGEVGQTQFMPKAILAYGTGNLENAANALSSTANFLKAHGWRAGAGYQPGEPNFAAIQAWNAAGVYQKAIALMGRQIDGGQ